MRKELALLAVLVIGLIIVINISYWPKTSSEFSPSKLNERSSTDREQVLTLIRENHAKEALKIIKQYKEDMEAETPEGQRWLALFIDASETIPDPLQLTILYEHSPQNFLVNEKASLLVAEQYIKTGQGDKYAALRAGWRNREDRSELWFVLDADRLVLEGKQPEAIAYLQSQEFNDSADAARLMRLGLLTLLTDPKESWKYFNAASKKDPDNSDLHIYKAKLLEAADKQDLAAAEYVTALQNDQKNPLIKNDAAEFYIRNGQYDKAIEIVTEGLPAPSSDALWIKALFWNKVLMPIKFNWAQHTPPTGFLQPLVNYLLVLNANQFWNDELYKNVANGHQYLQTQQATYWLRLLQALKEGQEKNAITLIENNPFQNNSWHPALELALLRILNYRQNGTLQLSALETPMKRMATKKSSITHYSPDLYKKIEELAGNSTTISPDFAESLKSKEAIARAFLAAGWLEASSKLMQ